MGSLSGRPDTHFFCRHSSNGMGGRSGESSFFLYPFIGFYFPSLELGNLTDFKRKMGGMERLCRLLAILPFT
jgi:hypothetical protein